VISKILVSLQTWKAAYLQTRRSIVMPAKAGIEEDRTDQVCKDGRELVSLGSIPLHANSVHQVAK